MFSPGDFIVEAGMAREASQNFGVVVGLDTAITGAIILEVQFPTERLYTFASHCQPYREWLDENGF